MARTTVPSAPHGVPQIAVTLVINLNEIMNVSDQDKSIHRSNQLTITNKERRLLQTEKEDAISKGNEADVSRLAPAVPGGVKVRGSHFFMNAVIVVRPSRGHIQLL